MVYDIGHALGLAADHRQLFLLIIGVGVGVTLFDQNQAAVGGHPDVIERLVELMGQIRGQHAQGGELGRLDELCLDLLLLRDVGEGEEDCCFFITAEG